MPADPYDSDSSSLESVALTLLFFKEGNVPVVKQPPSVTLARPDAASDNIPGINSGLLKSSYRGVSFDRKKRKWRVQIKVCALGKSGVSVGYFDSEEAAARSYDRAAIGLLGREKCINTINFPVSDYDNDMMPSLIGKTRDEVKLLLKKELAKVPRRRFPTRMRTSRYMGVGSNTTRNQWQARILVHGKVTHLGYYETEEEAARVYDRVSIALHGAAAHTNFSPAAYGAAERGKLQGLGREELQRALGVKPMDKSSRYRGVCKKKDKWEAKVMVNRVWAYRELFASEEEAAHAYDDAVWRLKPKEAKFYVNFKDDIVGDRAAAPPADGQEVSSSGTAGNDAAPAAAVQPTRKRRHPQSICEAPVSRPATPAVTAVCVAERERESESLWRSGSMTDGSMQSGLLELSQEQDCKRVQLSTQSSDSECDVKPIVGVVAALPLRGSGAPEAWQPVEVGACALKAAECV